MEITVCKRLVSYVASSALATLLLKACHSEALSVCPSQGVLPLNGTAKIGILKVPVGVVTCQTGIACDVVSLPVPNQNAVCEVYRQGYVWHISSVRYSCKHFHMTTESCLRLP